MVVMNKQWYSPFIFNSDQKEAKRQRAREKYTKMLADKKKAELNAKRRESYQRKKAEREAARNNAENLGIIFIIQPISLWVY